jgi:dCMP deaminase
MNKWDKRLINLAEHIAGWSKDPSTKCGAVITKNKRIISVGFNGFAMGCNDSPEIYEDRSRKYKRVLHAEQNAILFANQDLTDCTCYVWPMPPCSTCCAMLIQKGITRIVTIEPSDEQNSRWGDMFKETEAMCREAKVELVILMNNKQLEFDFNG